MERSVLDLSFEINRLRSEIDARLPFNLYDKVILADTISDFTITNNILKIYRDFVEDYTYKIFSEEKDSPLVCELDDLIIVNVDSKEDNKELIIILKKENQK